jgi:hypothetical protein
VKPCSRRSYGEELGLVGQRALRDVPRVAAAWAFIEEEARRGLSEFGA